MYRLEFNEAPPARAAADSMPSPAQLAQELPLSLAAARTVRQGRAATQAILERRDPRLLAIVGPCSIHDPVAGLDYARRLRALADELSDTLLLVMRVYFEKPRTVAGWKGLINDPHMDESCRIDVGMRAARAFMLAVNELGLPLATEALDPFSPRYLDDLVSWTAIGARTTESQIHREMASALPSPAGFKNGTDGGFDTAVNAIQAASQSHVFLGIDRDGRVAPQRSPGNRHAHLVLRGGGGRPNYDAASVARAEQALRARDIVPTIVIDCAHGNSGKQHERQGLALADIIEQRRQGSHAIRGFMLESFIEAGQQAIPADLSRLRYGCSVTDPCLGWGETKRLLRAARERLRG